MKILFCKIGNMKYYLGACKKDPATNGGAFVVKNGFGHEEYNFLPIATENGDYLFGFVETKHTNGYSNKLHLEKIKGCELLKKEELVEDVLVVWCATTDRNETSVVGWFKNATVFREYQEIEIEFPNEIYVKAYNVAAKLEDCVLLPNEIRHEGRWDVPTSRKRTYGFGQSLLWYAGEDNAQNYLQELTKNISAYPGTNDIFKEVDLSDNS